MQIGDITYMNRWYRYCRLNSNHKGEITFSNRWYHYQIRKKWYHLFNSNRWYNLFFKRWYQPFKKVISLILINWYHLFDWIRDITYLKRWCRLFENVISPFWKSSITYSKRWASLTTINNKTAPHTSLTMIHVVRFSNTIRQLAKIHFI